jgi:hypothetical protein
LLWLQSAITSSAISSEARYDTQNYSLVKRVKKKSPGRSLKEYYCVYISENGKTKAIKIETEECPEEI